MKLQKWKKTEVALLLLPLLLLILYTAWNSNQLRLAKQGQVPLHSLSHENRVSSLSYSPDGKHLATGTWTKIEKDSIGVVRLWAVKGFVKPELLSEESDFRGGSFSRSENLVLGYSSSKKKTEVVIWNFGTGNVRRTILSAALNADEVAFSPDSQLVVTSDGVEMGGAITQLWDSGTGKLLWTLPEGASRFAKFANNGKQIVRLGYGIKTGAISPYTKEPLHYDQIEFWNINTRRIKRVIQTRLHIRQFSISSDEKYLAAIQLELAKNGIPIGGTLVMFNLRTGREMWRQEQKDVIDELHGIPPTYSLKPELRKWIFNGLAFTPDSKTLVTGSGDYTARFWSVRTGSEDGSLQAGQNELTKLGYGYGNPFPIAISADSKYLATGKDKEVKIWDISSLVKN